MDTCDRKKLGVKLLPISPWGGVPEGRTLHLFLLSQKYFLVLPVGLQEVFVKMEVQTMDGWMDGALFIYLFHKNTTNVAVFFSSCLAFHLGGFGL